MRSRSSSEIVSPICATSLRRESFPGQALQHLQVRDRAAVVSADPLLRGPLALAHVEGDDEALAARLGGHHGDLGACDELARIGCVLGPDGDTGGDRELSDGFGLERRQLLADPLRERGRAVDVSCGKDHRELLTADSADHVACTHGRAEDVGDLLEQVVADPVSVDVVDLLEVVEVEHHDRDRLVRGRRAQELLPEPVMEGAVVVEAGQGVRLGLVLEPCADVRVVDGQGRRVAEALREKELLVRERRVLADAIDVERALELAARDEGDGDQRLGLDRRPRHEAYARVEVRPVREHGLAVVDGPARDALAERERLAHDLVRPLALARARRAARASTRPPRRCGRPRRGSARRGCPRCARAGRRGSARRARRGRSRPGADTARPSRSTRG